MYALQSCRSLKEKCFYDELRNWWNMHSVDESVVCLHDFHGHVGRHIDVFNGVHGKYGEER